MVVELGRGLLALSLAWAVRAANCPALCTATTDNTAWPCRYHASGCQVTVAANPARATSQDINVVVISPYSGGLGDLMTMVEPVIAAATQDVESSTMLPGFRMNVFLGDSKCTVPDATEATIEACSSGPTKHVIMSDSCSASCEAVNDAARYFNVLQVGPGCISTSLSDSSRYPYFTRMAPSYRFNVLAIYEFMMLMGFHRVGVIYGYRSINILAKDLVLEMMQDDVAAGRYNWTVLFTAQITSAGNVPDAQSVTMEMQRKDSRINFLALYQNEGSMLLCRSYRNNMLSPDYNFLVASGWWNPSFITERAGASDCNCSVPELHRAAFGVIAADRGPMLNTEDVHGLSGRKLADIYSNYTQDCLSFGGGKGVCNHQWAGYFYDGLWLIASILHTFLIGSNRSVADLATIASRQALYDFSLQVDFMGLTGRVRQFNAVNPTTVPASHGDRDGVILLRQAGGPPESSFNQLAYRSELGMLFQTDVLWSPDPAHRVTCQSGTCDLASAWLPPDRSSSCQQGKVWINELGCSECEAGEFASPGMAQCESCFLGYFASQPGSSACQPCQPGSYSQASGATSCSACQPGYFRNYSGATDCAKCPRGAYSSLPGRGDCLPCPPGLTTSFEGAAERSMCVCNGFYWQEQCIRCQYGERFDNGVCVTCNRSVICDGGLVVGLAPTDAEWANTINKAGRQLTLSQKMTNEFLLVALGIDPDENTRKMQATIGLFGATLQDLMLGNSSSQILAAPTKNALSYLQNQVQPAYAAMASFLMDNVGTSAGSKLYVLFEQNLALLDISQHVVDLFVKASEASGAQTSGLLVEIAGRQRSIIQKILKNVLFCALGVSIRESLQALRSSYSLFQNSHDAIILGASWASIPRLDRLCTMHQMRDVTFYFEAMNGPVLNILSVEGADAVVLAASAARNVSDLTAPLAEAMQNAVQLYLHDPGECKPNDNMKEGDWWYLIKSVAAKHERSQEVYRLYMQVAAGSLVEEGKVDLAVVTPTSTRELEYQIQGSRRLGIPAPPTQAVLSRLISLSDSWSNLAMTLEESLSLEQIPVEGVDRVEAISEDFRAAIGLLLIDVLEDALAAGTQRPVGLIATTSEQRASINRLAAEAYEISYGYHVEEVWKKINETIAGFHITHLELMLGAAATQTHPELRRVSNICVIYAMREVEDAYARLEAAALAVASGDLSELDSMGQLTKEADSIMATGIQSLLQYYEGDNMTCPKANLTSEEFQSLMLEASEACVLTSQAFGLFVREAGGDLPIGSTDTVETGLAALTISLQKLMLGYFDPHLPAPPSQTCYNYVLQLEAAVKGFESVLTDPDGTVVAGSAGVASVCDAAKELSQRYADEGAAAHAEWARPRAELANGQRVLAAGIFAAAAAGATGSLRAGTDGFERVHKVLLEGDGVISKVIPERQDLSTQWKQVDTAWQSFKAASLGSSIAAMAEALSDLNKELDLAVVVYGIPDVPLPPTSPVIFVVTYCSLGALLAGCGCAGCLMFYRNRRKANEVPTNVPSYA